MKLGRDVPCAISCSVGEKDHLHGQQIRTWKASERCCKAKCIKSSSISRNETIASSSEITAIPSAEDQGPGTSSEATGKEGMTPAPAPQSKCCKWSSRTSSSLNPCLYKYLMCHLITWLDDTRLKAVASSLCLVLMLQSSFCLYRERFSSPLQLCVCAGLGEGY